MADREVTLKLTGDERVHGFLFVHTLQGLSWEGLEHAAEIKERLEVRGALTAGGQEVFMTKEAAMAPPSTPAVAEPAEDKKESLRAIVLDRRTAQWLVDRITEHRTHRGHLTGIVGLKRRLSEALDRARERDRKG